MDLFSSTVCRPHASHAHTRPRSERQASNPPADERNTDRSMAQCHGYRKLSRFQRPDRLGERPEGCSRNIPLASLPGLPPRRRGVQGLFETVGVRKHLPTPRRGAHHHQRTMPNKRTRPPEPPNPVRRSKLEGRCSSGVCQRPERAQALSSPGHVPLPVLQPARKLEAKLRTDNASRLIPVTHAEISASPRGSLLDY